MRSTSYTTFTFLAALLLLLLTGLVQQPEVTPEPSPSISTLASSEQNLARVVRIIDGDTAVVQFGQVEETIRILGLDTPETVAPGKPVQCFGPEASQQAAALLQNQIITITRDQTQADRDRYGRLVRSLILEDGTDFALAMIAGGYGTEYTYSKRYAKQAQYREAENSAAEQGLGLWSSNTCNGER
jgi:micrococcal nuclease